MLNHHNITRAILPVSILFAMILLFMAVSSAQAQGNTIRVDVSNGSDSSTCGTAAAPCRSIQQAVTNAASGDLILVAQGEYRFPRVENFCEQYFDGLQAVVCIINKNIEIRGGYTSQNWDTPSGGAISHRDRWRGPLPGHICSQF